MKLVTLHGFTGHSEVWDGVLAGTHLNVCGHAKEVPAVSDRGFIDEVDRIAGLLPAAASTHLVGYSLGARLALGLAVRHPNAIAALTLIAANPGLTSSEDRLARQRADQRWVEQLQSCGIEEFVAAWENQSLWNSQRSLPSRILQRQREVRLRHDPLQLAQSLRSLGLGGMPNYWDDLGGLQVPTHLIAGVGDTKFSGLARSAASRIKDARLTLIGGSGHNPLIEKPDALRHAVHKGASS